MICYTFAVLLGGAWAVGEEEDANRDLRRINSEQYAETFARIQTFVPSTTLEFKVEYRPRFPGEDMNSVWSPMGPLTVGELISRKNSAVIHSASLEGRENEFIVKYTDDCSGPHTESMQNDYVMMAALNDTGLTPKVYFISRSAYLPHELAMLPRYTISNTLQNHFDACLRRNTRLRYMIAERVGPSLASYFEEASADKTFFASADFVRSTLVIMEKTLNLLERLHMHGIYHGDIHEGNIAFRYPIAGDLKDINIDEQELVLIDLEHGGFFPLLFGQRTDPRITSNHDLSLIHFSPWQLMGQRRSPRDDIFRLAMMTAVWSSLYRYQSGVDKILDEVALDALDDPDALIDMERDELLEIRIEENMFAYSSKLNSQIGGVVGNLNLKPMASSIVKHLESIRHHVLTCRHPDTTVSFPFIRERLRHVLNIFRFA